MYSERQLAGRDSADLVKPEGSLPVLVPTTRPVLDNADNVDNDDDDDENEDSRQEDAVAADIVAKQPAVVDDDTSKKSDHQDRPRPLTVTASIFQRSLNGKDCRKHESLQKDNAFPGSVQDEKAFVGVQALKESLEESVKEWKENDEPAATERQEDCRPSFTTTPFIFQVMMIDISEYHGEKWIGRLGQSDQCPQLYDFHS